MKQTTMALGLATAVSLVLASTVSVSAGGAQTIATARSGAPALSAPAPQGEAVPSTLMPPIHFEVNKARLRSQEEVALKTNAIWIKANPDDKVVIAGFADGRGPRDYNLALAERRARAVRDYLIKEGVRPERIEIVSYGVTDPRCTDQTEDCWAKNRRVELLVRSTPPERP